MLDEGPWAFNGHILLLRKITGMKQPMEVKFDTAQLRVKAYGVPPLKQIYTFAQFLAAQVGTFYACDEAIYTMVLINP